MKQSCWQLNQQQAELSAAHQHGFAARCNLTSPGAGLLCQTVGSMPLSGVQILGVALAGCFDPDSQLSSAKLPQATPEESYLRGTDLVAHYRPPAKLPLRTRLYWRALPELLSEQVRGAMELIVAVETGLLDSDPRSAVLSTIRGDSATWLPVVLDNGAVDHPLGCTLICLADLPLTYIEMTHPEGASHTSIQQSAADTSEQQIVHLLFDGRLEKGVVLTHRVRAFVIDSADAEQLAKAEYLRFAQSKPPLTT